MHSLSLPWITIFTNRTREAYKLYRTILFSRMMSNEQYAAMNFEFLPNEILIECFRYLNIFEIFYSFDELNNRINNLIYNIPLSINFENVNKLIFDQFCKKNPDIKNQIYSLKISNKTQCFQAKIFLSYFPLNTLSALKSFQLIIPMEFSAFQSIYGEKFDLEFYLDIKLSFLLASKLHTLTIPCLYESILDMDPNLSISNLTIGQCNSYVLYQLIKQFPRLQYLCINHVQSSFINEIDTNKCNIHLKKVILHEFDGTFDNFARFIKKIPNLESLTISNSVHDDMIDANQWQQLITTFLPYLNIFKFKFHRHNRRKQHQVIEKFKLFQTSFWQDKHWYTEYVVRDKSLFIHTLPYPFKIYQYE